MPAPSLSQPIQHPALELEVTRGEMVESRHTVAAAVVDAKGTVLESWGDVEALTYARSAIKPLQALPLLESGAADAFGLGERELALACASHGGEAGHVEAVRAWLTRLGLTPDALECGSHLPLHGPSADAMLRGGEMPTPAHNNCSGKHTGMLTHVMHMRGETGENPAGYIHPEHPAQQRVRAALGEMIGEDLARAPRGYDGCGLPQYGMSLRAMALGMARLADDSVLAPPRQAAARRIKAAMAAHPFYVAGTGRFCTAVIRATRGRTLVKAGAEGVYTAILPERGLGIALKVHDGSGRPRDVALAHLLRRLEVLDADAWSALAPFAEPVLRNHAGAAVGAVRLASGSLDG